MIKISNLNKYYNKGRSNQIHVVNDINLELPETSLVAILGDSGSGKSTLLNVIGGLDSAKGSIDYFDELHLDKYSPRKIDGYRNNNIGYIFQNYNLIDELTVYENLAYALELIGITDKKVVSEKIDAALDLVNMRRYKRRNALALSGGQQQRVSIARAIVKGAKVLIADEPTGNLDSRNTIDVMNILKSLSQSCLVLLVTHDKEVAYKYSDRIINLSDGKIVGDKDYDNNSLQGHDDIIYLSDYDKQNLSNDHNYLNVYSKGNENVGVNVYVKDNVVYVDVKSDLQTKIIGLNSNIEIAEVKPEVVENVKLDLDLFNNEGGNDHHFNYFKYFLNKLWVSFRLFMRPKTKIRLMYMSFILLGVIICINVATLNSKINVNVDSLIGRNLETVYVKDFYQDMEDVVNNNPELSNLFIDSTYAGMKCEISLPVIYNHEIDIYNNYSVKTVNHFSNIKYSKKLNSNEVLITNYVADDIVKNLSGYIDFSYDDLIGYSFRMGTDYYEIVGIEDLAIASVIVSDSDYYSCTGVDMFYSGESIFHRNSNYSDNYYKDDANFFGISIDESLVVEGKINIYISPDAIRTQILTDLFLEEESVNFINYNIDSNYSDPYYIFFDDLDEYANFTVANSTDMTEKFFSSIKLSSYYYEGYELVEGTAPVNCDDVIIADIFKGTDYETNIKETYNVTGYYKYSLDFIPTALMTFIGYARNTSSYYKDACFYTNDMDAFLKYFNENGYEAYYYKDYLLDFESSNLIKQNGASIITTCIMIVVALLFVFFIGRSKMLTKIKNIGIYRALGSSKLLILLSFIAEGVIVATFTIGLGFTGVYVCILFMAQSISYLEPFVFNFGYFILILASIYALTVTAISLPVVMLLRKTPVEIIAKYDI